MPSKAKFWEAELIDIVNGLGEIDNAHLKNMSEEARWKLEAEMG